MAKRIYIVDDDATIRRSLLTLLTRRDDCLVEGFASGEAFLDATPRLGPGIALLDLHMSGLSGLDVLTAVRRDGLPYLCVVVTGNGSIAVAVEAIKRGAIDFLEKPYDQETLFDRLERAFDRLARSGETAARAAAAQEQIARLAPREVDVLCGLIAGKVNKVIAHDLAISPRTVEVYRAHMMNKLHVQSLPDALRIAFAAGLVH
ncbi:response regulator transcription factor [Sphingomonas glacialis]|uniref:DNA-binding response regulator n=1 Tax=Sphingomonas glacialis TaxID=658225 RepID=A0A502FJR3_9SPHN|nr:response regulator [Sphingomonas glacialis]TPG49718.1 DNA-binding response regulator [Sphingomonas glacialis]